MDGLTMDWSCGISKAKRYLRQHACKTIDIRIPPRGVRDRSIFFDNRSWARAFTPSLGKLHLRSIEQDEWKNLFFATACGAQTILRIFAVDNGLSKCGKDFIQLQPNLERDFHQTLKLELKGSSDSLLPPALIPDRLHPVALCKLSLCIFR